MLLQLPAGIISQKARQATGDSPVWKVLVLSIIWFPMTKIGKRVQASVHYAPPNADAGVSEEASKDLVKIEGLFG
jgi:hypothetical protein